MQESCTYGSARVEITRVPTAPAYRGPRQEYNVAGRIPRVVGSKLARLATRLPRTSYSGTTPAAPPQDPRPRDLDLLVARHHALYLRTYEPCAHQLDQQISRKTIREQKGFGTAVGDASSSSTRRRLPPHLARRLFGIWYGERMGRGGSQESSPRTQAVNRTLPRCQPQFGAPMRFFFA